MLRIFSLHELSKYNGEDGPPYIAYKGLVYDVSDCPHWRDGFHENLHFAGQDLTGEQKGAPHGEEVFTRPCAKIVGQLQPVETQASRDP